MSSILELLSKGFAPTRREADTLLELAYLVTAADGRLVKEELAQFATLAARLRGRPKLGGRELDDLMNKFAQHLYGDQIERRVRELARALPADLHEIAYKIALALAFADDDPSSEEDRLHAVLGDALGLSPDRRAALSREVALGGGRAAT